MSLLIEIAEAVKDRLNTTNFGQSFVAQRKYVPVFELSEMDSLHVTVVPKATDAELADRARLQQDYQIDIGIQKRIDPDKTDEVDPLMTLVEKIADHFAALRLENPRAACIHVENRPVFDPEHMQQMRQLTSVLTLTFRTVRIPQ